LPSEIDITKRTLLRITSLAKNITGRRGFCRLHIWRQERVEQVAQRSCRCPIPGSVQGQVG